MALPQATNIQGATDMPSAKSYGLLHEQVATRPGATKRLAKLRKETLAEIELQETTRSPQAFPDRSGRGHGNSDQFDLAG